ncbi:hypothetical protein [Bdellovibrio sp. HCB337]|uniref:hypothetical protein n=1 Tax=Bdellovibrio sp. HCB337 TaxID=3394358 RepID=UPI0039A488D4
MRISKLVLNFALLTAVTSISATSSASSTCNMRNGSGRNAQTNPKVASVSKSVTKVQKVTPDTSVKGRRGKR